MSESRLSHRFIVFLRKHANRPWFLPFVCFLAFIDLFIIILPTEGMIMTTTVMRPRRWLLNGTTVATASACGAVALAMAAHAYGEPFIAWILGSDFLTSARWLKTEAWVDAYGFWAVLITALGPFPQQPVILVAAVANMHLPEIFFGAWCGRIPKYNFFAYLASRGERWLREEIASHPSFANLPRIRDFLLRLVHEADTGEAELPSPAPSSETKNPSEP